MTTEPAELYCFNHPSASTMLRCKRCNEPICVKCAIKTPTGYQCPQCVKKHQKAFDTAEPIDFVTGFVTAAILSALASLLVGIVGSFGFFAWFAILAGAPTAGAMMAESCRAVTRRHRSAALFRIIAIGAVIGALPFALLNFGAILYLIAYLVLAVPTLYTRLSGIQLFR